MASKQEQLNQINAKIAVCQKCPLAKTRTNTVPGTGNINTDIVFIGEGPGKSEDEQGIPFIGAAGRILNEMLHNIELDRDDIFITNIVKCRPPKNRDPKITEKNICNTYLQQQLALINPTLIIPLGRHAMEYFLPNAKISETHGKPQVIITATGKSQVIYPLYHPAAALYNPRTKLVIADDFALIPSLIKKYKNV